MKLRNKKTGEIVDWTPTLQRWNGPLLDRCYYNALAELCEEWEDYEEPNEIWYIDWQGGIRSADIGNKWEREKEIGNYFETKEEAEKAVEKLKAWKRMKDTGCEPIKWNWKHDYPNDACYVEVVLKCQFDSGVHDKELDLLFGGEK